MTAGGSTGGGILQTSWPFDSGYPPFARGARLRAIAEKLRAENWPVDVPITGSVTNDETSPDANLIVDPDPD